MDNLPWSRNTTTTVRKAQQWLHFLRILKRNNLGERLLVAFYRSAVESVLTYGITAWFALQQRTRQKNNHWLSSPFTSGHCKHLLLITYWPFCPEGGDTGPPCSTGLITSSFPKAVHSLNHQHITDITIQDLCNTF